MTKLSITTELTYDLPALTDVLLQVEAAAIPEQTIERAHIHVTEGEHFARVPGHDTIGERIWLRLSGALEVSYQATIAINRICADCAELAATPPHLLPGEAVDYLMPSRYCPSDRFQSLVETEFGPLQGGARVIAMRDWINANLSYELGSSTAATGALETYVERRGVCRDFAHLLISMTRASAIPARFASVYGLGVEPQDFHAVAEVFLDGAWYLIDATGMSKGEDMAKIAIGRDAADVSFLTSYGAAILVNQSVNVRAA
ncbi:MAG: transglutaminase family protein [Novosphingobium sp.]